MRQAGSVCQLDGDPVCDTSQPVGRELLSLSPKDHKEEVKSFYSEIRNKGVHDIVSSEIKMSVRSGYVPNLLIIDCPGLGSVSPYGNVGDVSKFTLKKYLADPRSNNVFPIIYLDIRCKNSDGVIYAALR